MMNLVLERYAASKPNHVLHFIALPVSLVEASGFFNTTTSLQPVNIQRLIFLSVLLRFSSRLFPFLVTGMKNCVVTQRPTHFNISFSLLIIPAAFGETVPHIRSIHIQL